MDFVSAGSVPELAAQMNQLVEEHLIDGEALRQVIEARDLQVGSGLGKDPQVVATSRRGDSSVTFAAGCTAS